MAGLAAHHELGPGILHCRDVGLYLHEHDAKKQRDARE
jgi:hypothetical protein